MTVSGSGQSLTHHQVLVDEHGLVAEQVSQTQVFLSEIGQNRVVWVVAGVVVEIHRSEELALCKAGGD